MSNTPKLPLRRSDGYDGTRRCIRCKSVMRGMQCSNPSCMGTLTLGVEWAGPYMMKGNAEYEDRVCPGCGYTHCKGHVNAEGKDADKPSVEVVPELGSIHWHWKRWMHSRDGYQKILVDHKQVAFLRHRSPNDYKNWIFVAPQPLPPFHFVVSGQSNEERCQVALDAAEDIFSGCAFFGCEAHYGWEKRLSGLYVFHHPARTGVFYTMRKRYDFKGNRQGWLVDCCDKNKNIVQSWQTHAWIEGALYVAERIEHEQRAKRD